MEISDEQIQKAFNNEENKYLLGMNSEKNGANDKRNY